MRSEKGAIVLFIIFILILMVLTVSGLFLFKRGTLPFFKWNNNPPGIGTKREGEPIDLSKKPSAKYLPDYITHCNNTAGYHWTGDSCVHN